jgi:hypothetical protein
MDLQGVSFRRILALPVLIRTICDLRQPRPVFDQFQQLDCAEEFDAVGRAGGCPDCRMD